MKKTLLILPVLLISLCALAATDPQSEKQAEEFYREGKVLDANMTRPSDTKTIEKLTALLSDR